MLKKISLLCLFSGLLLAVVAQTPQDSVFRLYEDTLVQHFKQINKQLPDDSNKTFSAQFEERLLQLITDEYSLHFSFDSLKKHIGVLTSEDGNLRLYNWNLLHSNGKYSYRCVVQYYCEDKKKTFFYRLNDQADSIAEIETTPSTVEAWFGCLYYQIIQKKHQGRAVYTLLGWNGYDLFTNRKVAECLQFSDSGKPQFGKTYFVFDKAKKRRVVFEYSERSSMAFRYEDRLDMIVFDHLSPAKEVYKGHAEFYGSDFSYDALQYNDDVWKYLPDVDIRNIKPPKTKKKEKAKRENNQ